MKEEGKIPGKEAGDSSRFSNPPHGYFEDLEARLTKRIAEAPLTVKRRSLSVRVILPLLAAAVILIGIFILIPDSYESAEQPFQARLESISEEEIVAALLSERIDVRDLAENSTEALLSSSDSLLQDTNTLEELSSDPNLEYIIEEL